MQALQDPASRPKHTNRMGQAQPDTAARREPIRTRAWRRQSQLNPVQRSDQPHLYTRPTDLTVDKDVMLRGLQACWRPSRRSPLQPPHTAMVACTLAPRDAALPGVRTAMRNMTASKKLTRRQFHTATDSVRQAEAPSGSPPAADRTQPVSAHPGRPAGFRENVSRPGCGPGLNARGEDRGAAADRVRRQNVLRSRNFACVFHDPILSR